MLKRFKTLLGKSEAECSTSSDKELTKKLDELMIELEAQKLQVNKSIPTAILLTYM